jgi:signal transduction histidine kinase
VLDDYGLAAALRWFGERLAGMVGVSVELFGSEEMPRLDPSVENVLYRIAQEALTNVVKHAQARRVRITFAADETIARMIIADDGVGFNLSSALGAGGGSRGTWGIIGMRERAASIGGKYLIDSLPGGGTRVTVEVAR